MVFSQLLQAFFYHDRDSCELSDGSIGLTFLCERASIDQLANSLTRASTSECHAQRVDVR